MINERLYGPETASVTYVSPDPQLDDMLEAVGRRSGELVELAGELKRKIEALKNPDRTGNLESVVDCMRNMNADRPYTDAELGVILDAAIPLPVDGIKGTAEEVDEMARQVFQLRQSPRQAVLVDRLQMSASLYVERRVRELSAALRILPPERATQDMLVYDESELLRIVWEKEPDSPGAKWVPLETVPEGKYITSLRYSIPLARVLTADHKVKQEEILSGHRKFHELLDVDARDMAKAIDCKFFGTVNEIVFDSDAQGEPNHVSGKVQWMDLPATADGFKKATSMLPTGNKDGRFVCRNFTVAASPNTVRAMLDAGVDISKYGMDLVEIGLLDDSVDGFVYFFAEPLFLGKCFHLGDLSTYFKAEAFFSHWFLYGLLGFAFGNTAAMAVARFDVCKDEESNQ